MLLLLSIWPSQPSTTDSDAYPTFLGLPLSLLSPLLPLFSNVSTTPLVISVRSHPLAQALAAETMDREWLVRNVLGGLGAGFSLRLLRVPTAAVWVGWTGKLALGRWIERWTETEGSHPTGISWSSFSVP